MSSPLRSIAGSLVSNSNSNVVFISQEESTKKPNIARGLSRPGWYRAVKYLNPNGEYTYTHEVLYLLSVEEISELGNVEIRDDDHYGADGDHAIYIVRQPTLEYYLNNDTPTSYRFSPLKNVQVHLRALEGQSEPYTLGNSILMTVGNSGGNDIPVDQIDWYYSYESGTDEGWEIVNLGTEENQNRYGHDDSWDPQLVAEGDDRFELNINTGSPLNNYRYRIRVENSVGSLSALSREKAPRQIVSNVWALNGLLTIPTYTKLEDVRWNLLYEIGNTNSLNIDDTLTDGVVQLQTRRNSESDWITQRTTELQSIIKETTEPLGDNGNPPLRFVIRGLSTDISNVPRNTELKLSNTAPGQVYSDIEYRFKVTEKFRNRDYLGKEWYSDSEQISMDADGTVTIERIKIYPSELLDLGTSSAISPETTISNRDYTVTLDESGYSIIAVNTLQDQVGFLRSSDARSRYIWEYDDGSGFASVPSSRRLGSTGDPGYDISTQYDDYSLFISSNRASGTRVKLKTIFGTDLTEAEEIETIFTLDIDHEIDITEGSVSNSGLTNFLTTDTASITSISASTQYGTLTYQWQLLPTLVTMSGNPATIPSTVSWRNIQGKTSNTLAIATDDANTTLEGYSEFDNTYEIRDFQVRCFVSGATYADDEYSNPVDLKAQIALGGTITLPDFPRFLDRSPQSINADVSALTGYGFMYRWFAKSINDDGEATHQFPETQNSITSPSFINTSVPTIPGSSAPIHTLELEIRASSQYSFNTISQTVRVRVNYPITRATITATPSSISVAGGESTIVIVVASSTYGTLSYEWEVTDDGTSAAPTGWTTVSGETGNSFTKTAAELRALSTIEDTATTVYVRCKVASDWANEDLYSSHTTITITT